MGIGLTGTSPKRALRGPSARVTLKDLSTVNVRTVMPPSTVARAAASPPHASTSPAAFPLFGDSFISQLILDRKTAPPDARSAYVLWTWSCASQTRRTAWFAQEHG